MTSAIEQPASLSFKAVAGGYIYRAPNPWVFGKADHYLVDQAQKDQIVALQTPANPRRLGLAVLAWSTIVLLAFVAGMNFVPDASPFVAGGLTFAALLLVPYFALHVSVTRQLERIRPILASAKPTDQVISNAEIREAADKAMSAKQSWLSALAMGAISVLQIGILALDRNQKLAFLSDTKVILALLQVAVFGVVSALSFKSAFRKLAEPATAVPVKASVIPNPSRPVVLGSAILLLASAAVLATLGVRQELSDQSLGLRYEAKGEHDNAIASFSKAIAADPANKAAYAGRAKSYTAKGDPALALADLSKVIELDPNDSASYRNRASAYRTSGDPDRALSDFNKAIALDPKDQYAYYFRGTLHATRKDFDSAIQDFGRAIDLNPKDPFAYSSRAQSYEAKNDKERALQDFNRSVEVDPKHYWGFYDRGRYFESSGKTDLAIADYSSAIQIDPKRLAVYLNRATAYERKGSRNLAIDDLKAALALAATSTADRRWQQEARQRLDKLIVAP